MIPHDQADELRALARRAQNQRGASSRAPRRVIVTSGTAGVGTSTVAVRLSLHLVQRGLRTVLVDAASSRPDATRRCEIEDHPTIAEVLAGDCGIHEVLRPTCSGLQVVPGAWANAEAAKAAPSAQQRLLHEIDSLGDHCEVAVVDAGTSANRLMRRFWESADTVLLVATADEAAVMDAYAAIKVVAVEGAQPPVLTVINQSLDCALAADAHRRISLAARRFLGLDVGLAAVIPLDAHFAAAPMLELEQELTPESAEGMNALAQAAVGAEIGRGLASTARLHAVQ